MKRARIVGLLALVTILGSTGQLGAQQQNVGLDLPLTSPRAEIRQTVGLTEIGVWYHRPAVNERTIWGGLVPYGQVWRAGANENTLVTFSTDVTVEGQQLAAGTYGLHAIPSEEEWVIIFSGDTTAWGSFSYTEDNDVLRVTVKPVEAPFRERMAFRFDELTNDSVALGLHWETLLVPIKVGVDTQEVVLASVRDELKGVAQFSWIGWNQATNYCLQEEINYEEALEWAERGIQAEKRFETLSTKARLLEKTGETGQAAELMQEALAMGNAGQLHQYARSLVSQERKEEALEVFQRNVHQNSDSWFVELGLARGYSALGDFDKAAENMKIALERAPDARKAYVQSLVERLEQEQDIN
jgi:thioredoxin-like negative regulator of GroEL